MWRRLLSDDSEDATEGMSQEGEDGTSVDDEGFDSSLTTELMDGVTEGEKGPTMGQKIMEQLLELMKKLPSKYCLYFQPNFCVKPLCTQRTPKGPE